MQMKNIFFLILSIILISIFFMFITPSIGQVYENIGFKKDVPDEIKNACSICDEFLDVKWIDEERYIGKLKTEWYKNGQKQGVLHLLVKLEEPGSEEMLRRGNFIFYEITDYEYKNIDFEKFIKQAQLTYEKGYFFMITKLDDKREKFTQGKIPTEFYLESYANFTKTVCVLYPGKEYIFIVETKKPFVEGNFNKNKREKYDQIIKYVSEICLRKERCLTDQIKYSDSIDVNFDKLDDYIFRFWADNKRKILVFFTKKNKEEFKDISNCTPYMPVFLYKTK